MNKKYIFRILLSFLLFGMIGSSFTKAPLNQINVQSISNSSFVRIFVVRPKFWASAGAKQFLRTAPSANDLNNKTNINYHEISGFTSDSYYDNSFSGDGTFNEYEADGIVYFDIPKNRFYDGSNYLFFDLIRENPSNSNEIWNDTGNHQFFENINHRILRIFGNGGGLVTSISGTTAESRNIANSSLTVILNGYLTCEDSNINGYRAYDKLRDNFNLEGRGDLSAFTLTDFSFTIENGVVSYDYSNAANRTQSTNVQLKINRMKLQAGF